MHAAKGLEFDTVILPDLEFPSPPPNIFLVDEPRSLVLTGQVETLSAQRHALGDEVAEGHRRAARGGGDAAALLRGGDAREGTKWCSSPAQPQKRGFYKYVDEIFESVVDRLAGRTRRESSRC